MILRPNKPTRRDVLEENERISRSAYQTSLLANALLGKLGGSIRLTAADMRLASQMRISGVVEGDDMVFSIAPESKIVMPDGEPATTPTLVVRESDGVLAGKPNGTAVLVPEPAAGEPVEADE